MNKLQPSKWYLIDASNVTLGRLSTRISILLRGKNKPDYQPGVDNGNFVVILNAEKVKITGKKESQKIYYRHSGRPGGLKQETFATLQKRFPEKILEKAVKGMLPKNSLGRQYFRRLKVLKGSINPYQNVENIEIIKF